VTERNQPREKPSVKEVCFDKSDDAPAHQLPITFVKCLRASRGMWVFRWFLLSREDEGEAAGLERTKREKT